MITHLAAGAANCTGTWSQKWKCGSNQSATATAHAGYTFGHSMVPVLIVLAGVFLIARAVRKRRKGGSPASAGAGR